MRGGPELDSKHVATLQPGRIVQIDRICVMAQRVRGRLKGFSVATRFYSGGWMTMYNDAPNSKHAWAEQTNVPAWRTRQSSRDTAVTPATKQEPRHVSFPPGTKPPARDRSSTYTEGKERPRHLADYKQPHKHSVGSTERRSFDPSGHAPPLPVSQPPPLPTLPQSQKTVSPDSSFTKVTTPELKKRFAMSMLGYMLKELCSTGRITLEQLLDKMSGEPELLTAVVSSKVCKMTKLQACIRGRRDALHQRSRRYLTDCTKAGYCSNRRRRLHFTKAECTHQAQTLIRMRVDVDAYRSKRRVLSQGAQSSVRCKWSRSGYIAQRASSGLLQRRWRIGYLSRSLVTAQDATAVVQRIWRSSSCRGRMLNSPTHWRIQGMSPMVSQLEETTGRRVLFSRPVRIKISPAGGTRDIKGVGNIRVPRGALKTTEVIRLHAAELEEEKDDEKPILFPKIISASFNGLFNIVQTGFACKNISRSLLVMRVEGHGHGFMFNCPVSVSLLQDGFTRMPPLDNFDSITAFQAMVGSTTNISGARKPPIQSFNTDTTALEFHPSVASTFFVGYGTLGADAKALLDVNKAEYKPGIMAERGASILAFADYPVDDDTGEETSVHSKQLDLSDETWGTNLMDTDFVGEADFGPLGIDRILAKFNDDQKDVKITIRAQCNNGKCKKRFRGNVVLPANDTKSWWGLMFEAKGRCCDAPNVMCLSCSLKTAKR